MALPTTPAPTTSCFSWSAKTIYEDHVSLLKAIEQKDAAAAHRIAGQHMQRYTENLSAIREAFHTISKPETTVSRSEMPYLCQKMRHFFVQFLPETA